MTKKTAVKIEMTPASVNLPRRGNKRCSLIDIRDEKDRIIGQLNVISRKVVFRGKCDLAARAFFQSMKGFIEAYIKESLKPPPDVEDEMRDETRLKIAMRALKMKKEDYLSHNVRDGVLIIVTQNGQKHKIV